MQIPNMMNAINPGLNQVSRAIEELYQLPKDSVTPKNENEPHLIK